MTDLVSKYLKLQEQYPDAIVIVRLGDSYEALGESAKRLVEQFDLTLTSRSIGLQERTPMCGFPYHLFDSYVSKLVNNGKRVVIVENIDDIRIQTMEEDS